MDSDIDTFNYQFVGSMGDTVMVLSPKQQMTKTEALTHAAWLVLVAADGDTDEFTRILDACKDT